MQYQVDTLKDRLDLIGKLKSLNQASWPDFIYYGDSYSWGRYYDDLSEYILVLTDTSDTLIGGGFTVPNVWSGKLDELPSTIEEIVENGLGANGTPANTLIPVAALVDKDHRGKNLSTEILKQMKKLAVKSSFEHLVIPVRPTWKTRYPLQSIENYAKWQTEDGLLYDPWLRTHQRLGAKVMKCVDSTLKIEGTIKDWERWTGMLFPESGAYIVRGALQPVEIDIESNIGVYDEPNVWMQHPLC